MKEFTLDCFGEACPLPQMKTEKQMEKMEVGDVVIVQVDHSCATKNVPEWARSQGYNVEIEEDSSCETDMNIVMTASGKLSLRKQNNKCLKQF